MTEWYELLKAQRGELKDLMKAEGVKARYARFEFPLGSAVSNQEMHLTGDYIGVVSITGTGTVKIRLDHRHSQEIDLREVAEISAPFGKMYFTTDGAGGTCTVYIGGALAARLKPIQAKVSIRSVAGTDVDLLTEAEFKSRFVSHTGGHSVNALGTPDTAERVMAASTKVKWAIIYTDLAIRWGFASTVHRTGPIGVLLAAAGTLTLEYCDLYDVYFNNNVGAESPKLQIEYVVEA
jgi:hypothetical protein